MGKESNITWCDSTWNIARGCSKVDEDCKFCYMYRQSLNKTRYDPGQVIRTKTVFDLPRRLNLDHSSVWHGRPLIFTSSLTDFFHPDIDSYRQEAWDIIRDHPQYIFQILTKRPERIREHLPEDWGEGWGNVWLGTSIGSQKSIQRLGDLILPISGGTRFLSLEPLHGPIELGLGQFVDMGHKVKDLIDWVIIGGESGNDTGKYRYRPCELTWIFDLIHQCKAAGIPVFVKQLGTHIAQDLKLRDRHGGNINEWPAGFRVREFPLIGLEVKHDTREYPCLDCDTGEMTETQTHNAMNSATYECNECGHSEQFP